VRVAEIEEGRWKREGSGNNGKMEYWIDGEGLGLWFFQYSKVPIFHHSSIAPG
jgi:hypothetical protein